MTELGRTERSVAEIETMIQAVVEGSGDVGELARLVGEVSPTVAKLATKAAETDPAKQRYGPATRKKIEALAEKWATVESLATDVLQARNVSIPQSENPSLAPPPPRPPTTLISPLYTPPGGAAPVSYQPDGGTRTAAPSAPSSSSGSGQRLGGSASSTGQDERRRLAAAAAEARLSGPPSASAAAGSSQQAPAQPRPSAGDLGSPTPMDVDADPAQSTASPAAVDQVVNELPTLLSLVHEAFVGHGFEPRSEGQASAGLPSTSSRAPFRVKYLAPAGGTAGRQVVSVLFVPVQQHLVVYAISDGQGRAEPDGSRVALRLGMSASSVLAKVDYLLVYPLVTSQLVPALPALPVEVAFNVLRGLSIPALGALTATSKSMGRAVAEDDTLWFHIATSLPLSAELSRAMQDATERQRSVRVAGLWRSVVKAEVQRLREEAELRRRRREEQLRLEEQMRRRMEEQRNDPLRQPSRGYRPPGIIGGDFDLFPGGFPGGGGRRPWPPGGGGGPFGPGFGGGGMF